MDAAAQGTRRYPSWPCLVACMHAHGHATPLPGAHCLLLAGRSSRPGLDHTCHLANHDVLVRSLAPLFVWRGVGVRSGVSARGNEVKYQCGTDAFIPPPRWRAARVAHGALMDKTVNVSLIAGGCSRVPASQSQCVPGRRSVHVFHNSRARHCLWPSGLCHLVSWRLLVPAEKSWES